VGYVLRAGSFWPPLLFALELLGGVTNETSQQQPAIAEAPMNGAAPPSRLAITLRALHHRNFQLFFAGQVISQVGTWTQLTAQWWLVYRLTGSSLLLGSIGFCSQTPIFLIAPLAGMLADRHSRHRILICTQIASMLLAFVLAALTLSGRVQVWHIFVLSAGLGVINGFDMPTRQAFVVEMVGKQDLMNAIALNSSMVNAARIVGPAVAGILVASIGEGWCFLINAVGFTAAIIALLRMRMHNTALAAHEGSALANLIAGFKFVRHTVPIRALLLLLSLVSLVGMPYSVLMPIFADKILHGGARGLGLLMGANGVGSLVGTLALASRTGLRGLGKLAVVCAFGFGLGLILFGMSRHFWVSVALMVLVGFCMFLQFATTNTLLQAMVPDHLRARVMAVYSMVFMGMGPIGAFMAGALAQHFGAPLAVILGGIGCIAGSVPYWLRLPSYRGEMRQLIVAQGMAGSSPAQGITAMAEASVGSQ
jgi:MFS family permease